MRASVCSEAARTLSPDGQAIAESDCLPQIAAYVGDVLVCYRFP
jgi:hypothetical protein